MRKKTHQIFQDRKKLPCNFNHPPPLISVQKKRRNEFWNCYRRYRCEIVIEQAQILCVTHFESFVFATCHICTCKIVQITFTLTRALVHSFIPSLIQSFHFKSFTIMLVCFGATDVYNCHTNNIANCSKLAHLLLGILFVSPNWLFKADIVIVLILGKFNLPSHQIISILTHTHIHCMRSVLAENMRTEINRTEPACRAW